jgi:UDP-glucose 4-epimerase
LQEIKFENEVFLVTGAAGHIGSYIVEWLAKLARDSIIICADNFYNGNLVNLTDAIKISELNNNTIKLFSDNNGDVSDILVIDEIFKMYKPTYVFHQASMLTLDSKKDRLKALNYNTVSFTNVCEYSLLYDVKKLVFASSASVYGNPDKIPTPEWHHFNNCILFYGATKIANEYIARSYSDEEGLKFIGLRYFNVYGERQSTKNVYTQIVPKWIKAIIDNEQIIIYGDGKQTMDMIHGEDVGRLNVLAAFNKDLYRKEGFDGFLNIGSGIETSVLELYNIMVDVLKEYDITYTKEIQFQEHDPNLVKRRKADTILMNVYLGYPSIDVREGIKRSVQTILGK